MMPLREKSILKVRLLPGSEKPYHINIAKPRGHHFLGFGYSPDGLYPVPDQDAASS